MVDEIDLGIDGLSQFKEIGSGGFATVYAAVDDGFGRWVAVKILHSLDDDGRRRFDRERGLMGRLDEHANVVTPYRFGYTNTGWPYLVMEYARRGSLHDLITDDGPLLWDQAVAYLLPIAGALGRAHSEGILHRDVKPANILLTGDGVPKLTDFGIGAIREATATQVAFTLAHAAPETFAGGQDQRDERSDLYSLASTLFCLVTGRAPYQVDGEDSQPAYMLRVLDHPIPSLDTDPRHDGFLVTALAKSPNDRPPTAAQFTEQLEATLQPLDIPGQPDDHEHIFTLQIDEPIDDDQTLIATEGPQAADPRAGSKAPSKRLSPRRLVVGTGILAAGAILVGIQLASDPNTEATQPSVTVTTSSVVTSEPSTIETTSSSLEPPPTTSAPASLEPIVFSDHTNWVSKVVLLDDGRIASTSYDGTVRIWDPDNPSIEPIVFTDHKDDAASELEDTVNSVAVLPDGRIASASRDATVRVWDPDNPSIEPIVFTDHTGQVLSVAVLGDGRIASADRTVLLWDPDNPSIEPIVFTGDGDGVGDLTVMSDGRLVSASSSGTVRVWDPDNPSIEPIVFTGHTDWVGAVAVLDDGRIASASGDGTVLIWDPDNPSIEPIVFTGHTDWVGAVAVLDDGRIASGGGDDTVLIWDPDNLSVEPIVFADHTRSVVSLAVLNDGRIASASFDKTVRVWDPGNL